VVFLPGVEVFVSFPPASFAPTTVDCISFESCVLQVEDCHVMFSEWLKSLDLTRFPSFAYLSPV